MAETIKKHARQCEGHIDCPKCGPESCSKVVIWSEPGGTPHAVVCLTCWQRFDVSEEDADDPHDA